MSENDSHNKASSTDVGSSHPDIDTDVTANGVHPTAETPDQAEAPQSLSQPSHATTNIPPQNDQTTNAKGPEDSVNPEASTGLAGASYGTRSRNRTSGARPNYAEDKDLEMDVDVNGANHTESSVKKASQPSLGPGATEDKVTGSSSSNRRGGFATVNGNSAANPQTASSSKDGTPSTTSGGNSASQTSTAPSKKRKQPGTHVTTSTASTSAQPPSRTRGASAAYAESNMMSFERSGGYLKNGKLKADDGTVLSINGESNESSQRPIQ